ncbi:MAG TPA: alpha/beta hydrolase, partial [Solirubrobacteraceae bacterium]|nr:alpha/beta hydrolase [Solirubrobacteraceae bacterium]
MKGLPTIVRRLVPILALAALLLVPAVDRAGAPAHPGRSYAEHVPCPPGLAQPWQCSIVSVRLDRSGRVRGRVHLAVALLHRPGPPRPAVLALAGGPGAAALPGAKGFARILAPLLTNRDLLVVDQRGTGASDPIACPQIEADETWSAAAVTACAQQLGPAGAFYSTDASVGDLETVRHMLAIPALTVYGVSYGTKVAVDYARAHPKAVDGLVLDSPIVEDTDPFYRRSANGAQRVLENLCAENACVAHADPGADLRTLVGMMRGGVLTRRGVSVSEGSLLHAIVAGGPRLHALPPALHTATGGDLRPLAALLPRQVPDARDPSGWLAPSDSSTVYLATSCEDGDFPWAQSETQGQRLASAEAYLDRLGDRAFAPFDRYAGEQYGEARICAPWPEAGRRPAPAPLPDVPALLLVGGDDDLAPLEGAKEIAAQLPHSRLVVVPDSGHGVLHGTAG